MAKKRADNLLLEQGLAETRSQARALIMAGQVLAGSRRIDKAGEMLPEDELLSLKDQGESYASRGGFKLEGALDDFGIDVTGLNCLDVGASTGGFTDCLLKRGAANVTAVDVGYGLIHWRLRQDPRVRVVERINARAMTEADVGGDYDFCVVDVSFISLSLVLPAIKPLLRPGRRILALVKPQFEVGKDRVGKGGVVRDQALIEESVEQNARKAVELGFETLGDRPSRLKGPKGNQEQFLLVSLPEVKQGI
jgi:23S rRNA (cytidine1920-2'-O)/16S rRNA (cytidine1409-2'-O)-methyltransferase